MREDKRKAEVLNACFTSVFSSKSSRAPGTQLLELKDMDGEQKEAQIILEEMVGDLLHHLDMLKSMTPGVIHTRFLRELTEVITKPLSINYQ